MTLTSGIFGPLHARETTQQAPRAARTVHLTCANTIKPRPVLWGWEERLALGTIALCGGREGIGKSIFTYTLAADITRGLLPGVNFGKPRAVIVAATEDSWAHTIIPRLMAGGADLALVYRVDVATLEAIEGSLSLPHDLVGLEAAVRDVSAALIILDPLMSRLDANLDSHKDAEVRLALEPLVALADRTGAMILGLIHVNKSTSNDPLTTLMASRAFAAVARAVLFVMQDPDDDTIRLLGQPKNNLGRMDLPTLTFRINGAKVADTAEGPVWTGKLEWLGEGTRTIKDALAAAGESAGDKSATTEASEWLRDFLSEQGGTADSALVKREGLKAGHSRETLRRARTRVGVLSATSGFPRRAFWSLASEPNQSTQPAGETLSTVSTVSTAANPLFPVRTVNTVSTVARDPESVGSTVEIIFPEVDSNVSRY